MGNWHGSRSAAGQGGLTWLQHIDFSIPLTTDAKPGGILTGTQTATCSGAGHREETRQSKLSGASLRQDSAYPNICSHACDVLRKCLEKPAPDPEAKRPMNGTSRVIDWT